MQYSEKVSRDRCRLATVAETHPDDCGVVRTVTVVLRPRHSREKAIPYKLKELTEFQVAVQRLVVIVPLEEQQQEEGETSINEVDEQDQVESINTEDKTIGDVAAKTMATPRRSRRQRGEPPESLTAVVDH